MGIHQFMSWLKRMKNINFRDVLINRYPEKISSLMIDGNGIIYTTAAKVYAFPLDNEDINKAKNNREIENIQNQQIRRGYLRKTADNAWSQGRVAYNSFLEQLEEEHFAAIQYKLNEILVINPRDLLILSFDGAAPMAKIKQQRMRRQVSGRNKLEETEKAGTPYSWPLFDTISITPGTDFMFRLDAYINSWLNTQQEILPGNTIYYSHMVPGEGEHRIMDDIRSGKVEKLAGEDAGAHIIYGADSDLVMLGLIAPLDKLYIVREKLNEVVNIGNLRLAINALLNNSVTALSDFVLMFFLAGNDFLPRPPTMVQIWKSFGTLVSIYNEMYEKTGLTLTNKDTIHSVNWSGFSTYIQMLGSVEKNMLEREANDPPRFPSKILAEATTTIQEPPTLGTVNRRVTKRTINYEKYRNLWYNNALHPKSSLEDWEIKMMGDSNVIDGDVIARMVVSYIQGIGWINTYYHEGLYNVNINWFYPWDHAPLFYDIAYSLTNSLEIPQYISQPKQDPPNVIYQLLCVLPLASKNLLPNEVLKLLDINSPIADLYPIDFKIELDGVVGEFQGIPLLPKFQPDRIIEAVHNNITFSMDQANKYKARSGTEIIKEKYRERLRMQEIQTNINKIINPRRGKSRESYRGQYRENYRGQSRENYRGQSRENYRGQSRENYRGQSRENYRGQSRENYRGRESYRGKSRENYESEREKDVETRDDIYEGTINEKQNYMMFQPRQIPKINRNAGKPKILTEKRQSSFASFLSGSDSSNNTISPENYIKQDNEFIQESDQPEVLVVNNNFIQSPKNYDGSGRSMNISTNRGDNRDDGIRNKTYGRSKNSSSWNKKELLM